MAACILNGHGIRTGLFLSPHVKCIRERISIDGRWIPGDEFCRIMNLLAPHFRSMERDGGPGHPSYFEIVTAVALRYFADSGVGAAVLEVGMGGRWDATNIVKSDIAVITSVGLDHSQHLGETRHKIAAEKAGIIKEETGLFVSGIGTDDSVFEVLREHTARRNSRIPILAMGRDFGFSGNSGSCNFQCPGRDFVNLSLGIPGTHFIHDAALALTASRELMRIMNVEVLDEMVREVLGGFSLTGRMQILETGREEGAEPGPVFILDGAHNPESLLALRDSLEETASWAGARAAGRTIVFGVMRDKNIREMLQCAHEMKAGRMIFCSCAGERAVPSSKLLEEAGRIVSGDECELLDGGSVAGAVRLSIEPAGKNRETGRPTFRNVLVCGSFYVVGEALEELKRINH
jgi:dihydrofolate synthase/folylpolyglutamate synthase